MNISSDARRKLRDERREREREKPRDVVVELFGPNRRQPLGKGSMQIRARLGARRKGGEGGSRTVMEGTRRHRSKRLQAYARARKPWR